MKSCYFVIGCFTYLLFIYLKDLYLLKIVSNQYLQAHFWKHVLTILLSLHLEHLCCQDA